MPSSSAADLRKRQRLREILELRRRLPINYLGEEIDAYGAKWFSYSFVSPFSATRQFHDAYVRLFKSEWARNFDVAEASLKRAVAIGALEMGGREFTSLWRARLAADLLGVPYPVFVREAFNSAVRRGYKKLPRPNQLWTEQNVADIAAKWNEMVAATAQPVDDVRFLVENDRALVPQRRFRKFALDQIRMLGGHAYRIARAVYEDRVITEEEAEAVFGEERLVHARAEIEKERVRPENKLDADELWPSCIGLVGPLSGSRLCIECLFRTHCQHLSGAAARLLEKEDGSQFPAEESKREKNRIRVRRSRAKTKKLLSS